VLTGPIFARELVTTPRRPLHFAVRTVYVLALFILMSTAWMVLVGTQLVRGVGDMARFGSVLFQILAPLQMAVLTFLAAFSAASAVAQEKDRRTLILLLMTRLENQEVVLGKLLASLLDVLVMLLASVPFFCLTMLCGGVAAEQILRVFAVTLATVLAAGSLGGLIALWREKTFQSLSVTALILVAWVGLAETAAAFGDNVPLGDASLALVGAALSPIRAILAAAQPFDLGLRIAGLPLVWGYVIIACAVFVALVIFGSLRLRVWNPGREAQPRQEEEGPRTIFSPEHDAVMAGDASAAERARATHVDARVRQVSQESRQVWDNPVLWRETQTRAYGRKIYVIKLAYIALTVLVGLAVYETIRSGAALARSDRATTVPAAAQPLAPFVLLSLVIVNALAVTSITNERDGGALDLLLVTDLTPPEFLWGKVGGIAWVTKEMLAAPMLLALFLWFAGGLSGENLFYVVAGLAVMDLFVIMLGVHCGMNYANSRYAIGTSLGTVFFLFLGVTTLLLILISFSGSFQTQLAPFLAFILGGGVGLYVALGIRNESHAIQAATLLLPAATLFAVISYLLDHWPTVFLVTVGAYGFTIAAMMVPALNQFDFAMGRSKGGEE
jgi:ABC-type transport system involved in multi-copper enzyme maturation permease subunit